MSIFKSDPIAFDIGEFHWSGGKDSALALHKIREEKKYNVAALLTTVTEGYDRVSMHGVRRELLEAQALSLGLPLIKVYITPQAANEEYEARMKAEMEKARGRGIAAVVFADIFLEDLRKYREDNLAKVGMKAVFPLWKIPTDRLAREFIALGFQTIITCVDTKVLDGKFAGRLFDVSLLADLPPGVDPCGENGEFHSSALPGRSSARRSISRSERRSCARSASISATWFRFKIFLCLSEVNMSP